MPSDPPVDGVVLTKIILEDEYYSNKTTLFTLYLYSLKRSRLNIAVIKFV
jgi:hypothetical protein